MRKIFTFLLFIGCIYGAKADHITGGEMFYTFTGISGGNYQYSVTLKLFMRCNSGRQFSSPTYVSVFDKSSFARISDIAVQLSNQENINFTSNNPCITNPPSVCYDVGYYYFTLSLPPNQAGYIIASQVNYRIQGINNLALGYSQLGATYTAEIPGAGPTGLPLQNSSARFTGSDLVLVCADNSFSYSFAAQDPDKDELRYSFCDAYEAGGGGTPGNAIPPSSPPYGPLPYGAPVYSGSKPLGNNVQINPATGLITGLAPSEGKYVVTVCVEEIRGGVVIATQRKDVQINITPCTIAAASLLPVYMLCKNTRTITISNLSTSPLIKTYYWRFKNTAGVVLFSSSDPTPTYTFPDTGSYTIHLTINDGQQCSDSSSTLVRVYPGFKPAFDYRGICVNKITQFTDATTSVYGQVTNWSWDFGDFFGVNDASTLQHPSYTYNSLGDKLVQLIVQNSKGCIDTLIKDIPVVDKPPITLAFADTLICISDRVQLQAAGSGSFSWSPLTGIINPNSNTPIVSPSATTTYYVDLDDNGCRNRDSVKVRVVDHVTLQAMPDTVICRTDAIQLHIVSDALQYTWTSNAPASLIANAFVANPTVITNNASTTYEVKGFIGSCSAGDQVIVKTIPYPMVNAGNDTTICFQTGVQLHGRTDGNAWIWSPASTLNTAGILDPVASPTVTTGYVLSAFDTRGCPKPGRDTVLVTVLPDIKPNAGNDTTIVVGQPLQLQATGGVAYEWQPGTALSNPLIANPVAVFRSAAMGALYKVLVFNDAGCVDSTFVSVKVYETAPTVFVPNAFSPNGDSHNEFLRPVSAGIRRVESFMVFNRWGQLMYSSGNTSERGWDGTVAGKQQAPGAYVWVVKAVDYTGVLFTKRGTVLLVR
jgi:gliding motility-associated-like protein